MTTAMKVFQQIKDRAEEIRTDKPQRFPDAASVGDFWRQGDVYVTKISKCHGKQCKGERQVAPGTTQGSRHVLDSLDGVQMYRVDGADALTGPQIRLTQERTLTHPEHGNLVLPPGCYSITYQRAYADELRRVAD